MDTVVQILIASQKGLAEAEEEILLGLRARSTPRLERYSGI